MSLLSSYRSSTPGTEVSVPTVTGDQGGASDEFRLVKWHFLANASTALASGRSPHVILVTSAREGEGKSYVAHHLAANFALDSRANVTLIDANFDNPALGTSSWMGGGASGVGLLDYLDGAAEESSVIRATGLNNVAVILAGAPRENAPELFATTRFEQLLASRTVGNSFVIIDAGSVLSNSGAAVLARHAGQIAFVIAANSTRRADVNAALGTLDRIADPIDPKAIGLVFN